MKKTISIFLILQMISVISMFGVHAQEIVSNVYDSKGRISYSSFLSNNKFVEYKYDKNGNTIRKNLWGDNAYKKMSSIIGRNESFETDNNQDGIADDWLISGQVKASMSSDSKYGKYSQRLETIDDGGAFRQELGNLSAGRHFLVMLDYKANASNTVSMRLNDTQTDWGLNLGYNYFITDNTWRTAYVKFTSTGKPINLVAAYFDPGSHVVNIDGLRLYEITTAVYDQINSNPEYTGDSLIEKFSYGDLLDYKGDFELDDNNDGNANGWNVDGHSVSSLSHESVYGNTSQQLELDGEWASLNQELGTLTEGSYYLFLVSYKATSSTTVSMRVNDTQTNWGLNLGYKYFKTDDTWRRAHIKFQATGNPITIIGAYLDSGVSKVQVDGARLYKISESIYNRIDNEEGYSGDLLYLKYPYNSFNEILGDT
ncbi:hypothetical protein NBRC13296_25225 [Paenibacillus chitinolyticus]|uniref:hypothetical protein n=1 Tax=Paenibacillus chitinolyticus TaxID=79263 RepID=UPI003558EE3E